MSDEEALASPSGGVHEAEAAMKVKRQQYEQKRRDKIAHGFQSLRELLEGELGIAHIDSNTQALTEAERALRTLAAALARPTPATCTHAQVLPLAPAFFGETLFVVLTSRDGLPYEIYSCRPCLQSLCTCRYRNFLVPYSSILFVFYVITCNTWRLLAALVDFYF